MKLRHFPFRGVLEDNEYIVKSFRGIAMIFISELLAWGLVIWGVNWALYRYVPINYALWGIVPVTIIGLYKMIVIFNKWYLNAVLMTNENIIIVEWHRFFHKKSIVINYWNLDELQVEQKGVFAFIRNYGNVSFPKLNSGEVYVYKKLAHPHRVIREIHNHKESALHEKNFKEESALKDLISQMVQTHAREHGAPSIRKRDFDGQEHTPIYWGDDNIEYEKELDDFGGIDIDLSEEK